MGFGICPLGSQMVLWSRKSRLALAPQLLKAPGILTFGQLKCSSQVQAFFLMSSFEK